MVVGRLRRAVEPLSARIGGAVARLVPDPNILTFAGAATALLSVAAAYWGLGVVAVAMIALSGVMDALDGAVARALGKVSKVGSFLDSLADRVSDSLYPVALYLLGLDAWLSYGIAVTSLLVSYARSKAESLGVSLEGVGVAERGERVALITLIAALLAIGAERAATVLSAALLVANSITIAWRTAVTSRSLRTEPLINNT